MSIKNLIKREFEEAGFDQFVFLVAIAAFVLTISYSYFIGSVSYADYTGESNPENPVTLEEIQAAEAEVQAENIQLGTTDTLQICQVGHIDGTQPQVPLEDWRNPNTAIDMAALTGSRAVEEVQLDEVGIMWYKVRLGGATRGWVNSQAYAPNGVGQVLLCTPPTVENNPLEEEGCTLTLNQGAIPQLPREFANPAPAFDPPAGTATVQNGELVLEEATGFNNETWFHTPLGWVSSLHYSKSC